MYEYPIQQQPISTGAMSRFPFSQTLADALTFSSTDGEVVTLAQRQGDFLLVPRALAMAGKQDFRVDGMGLAPVQSIAQPPRSDEQANLIASSVAALQAGYDHIVEAPTGFGKTYVGAAVAAKLGKPTLIVVPKEDLMVSWFNTLRDLIGVPVGRIGKIQQDKCDYVGKLFVLGMLHSLVIPGRYDDEPGLLTHFGTVLFDEVHRLGADGFSRICHMFPARHRLGLSATPDRWDGKQRVFEAHLGPVLFRGTNVPMKPKVLVKQTGWRIPKGWTKDEEGQWVKANIKPTPGKMMPVTKKAAESKERNAIIADFVKTAYLKGRRVVVMSDLIENHLVPLFHDIAALGVPGNDMDYYVGGRKPQELLVAKTKPVVLATYQMCAEGTDVPEWDTLVLATPRSNVKQAIGRVMRIKEGKKQPIVLDLVDADPVYQQFYRNRERQYYEVGADIVRMAA